MGQMKDISIIIVNYNTKHVLQPCIDSIVSLTHGVSYEIIVVDNGSTDGSEEMFSNDQRIIWMPMRENLGFGKANNAGLQKACGKYIFFLNSDTLLVNNAIKIFYDYACKQDGHTGAIGCILEDRQGHPIHSYGRYPRMRDDISKLIINPIKKALHIYQEPPPALPETSMNVEYVTGADLFVDRAILEECGAFAPAFFMYCEEAEMQYRFEKRGYKNMLIHGPRIIHLEGEGGKDGKSSKFLRDCLRQQKSEYIYFKLTHPHWQYLAYRVVHPILRQTLWFNPHVSMHDKWAVFQQLFVKID